MEPSRRWWSGLWPERPNAQEIEEERRFHRAQLEAGGRPLVVEAETGLPEDTIHQLILRTLMAGAMHGWGVAERVAEVSEGTVCIHADALYPALHRLEHDGLVSAAWATGLRGRARYYTLTRAGRKRLGFEDSISPSRSRLRAMTPKRIADVLAPELTLPAERTLAKLKAPERRRGESYWGARPAGGLAHRLLDIMLSRATHTAVRPDEMRGSTPASRRRTRATALTETTAGRRAAIALLTAVVVALGIGLWLDARATALWIVGLVAAYLVWDVLLSSAIWVQINSRRLRSAAPAEPARTLTPRELRARHAALFFVHKLNYLLHLFRTFVYLAFLRNRWVRRATEEEIEDHCVEILIGSSYAIFLAQPAEHAGTAVFTLELDNQAISHEIGKFDNRLRVVVDAAARRIVTFEWNGADVPRWSERLQILCDIGSQSIHPKIHSFNPVLYADVDRVDRKYDRIFRHGQNLNNAAHHYPALCLLCPPRWFKVVLEANGAAPIPFHDAATLGQLARHSPYVRFMLAARGAYGRLVKKHEVGVNTEAFFICSALHSVDHAVYGALQDRVDFPGVGNNLVYRWFHLPVSVDWFMNNKLSENQNETPFYAELYDALHAIDPDYAELIDVSISN